jgi:hypothetical protein
MAFCCAARFDAEFRGVVSSPWFYLLRNAARRGEQDSILEGREAVLDVRRSFTLRN